MKFEDALKRLEELVRRLESGQAELEEALRLFEEGVKLVRWCQKHLEQAERRIEIIREREDGSLTTEEFDISAVQGGSTEDVEGIDIQIDGETEEEEDIERQDRLL